MLEVWRGIRQFPGYLVSNMGNVVNQDTGRNMTLLRNQMEIVYVSLQSRKVQYKRSVSLLVATEFLPTSPRETFTTPINLDGNRSNNEVTNLMWRPKGFAIRYFAQFNQEPFAYWGPIADQATGEQFASPRHAAMKYGLIEKDIRLAMLNRTFTWPTYQVFTSIRQK